MIGFNVKHWNNFIWSIWVYILTFSPYITDDEDAYSYIDTGQLDLHSKDGRDDDEDLTTSRSMEELQQRDIPVKNDDGHIVSRMLYNDECQAILRDIHKDLVVNIHLQSSSVINQALM